MWSKVPYLRKQHDGGDWASNHSPSQLKSNALTTTPPRPHMLKPVSGSQIAVGSARIERERKNKTFSQFALSPLSRS